MDKIHERVKEGKIVLETFQTLHEVVGDDSGVNGIIIKDVNNHKLKEIQLKGVFVAIGHKPNTEIFEGQLDMENGYILMNLERELPLFYFK